MPASLLTVVQTTPQIEPLPVYRRDPETSSIRSSAPSYVSEAPTYYSTIPASTAPASTTTTTTQRIGLPPANYAPGFHHIRGYDRSGLSHLNFSINQWSSVYSSPQARHYHNVAARRTNLAMIEEQALMTTLANQMISPPAFSFHTEPTTTTKTTTTASNTINTPSLPAPTATTATTITTQQQSPISQSLSTPPRPLLSPPQQSTNNPEPHSPLEDPDLVGPVAAAAARERRLYMAHELHLQRQRDEAEAQALREDSRRWDFLLAQMTDWKDREQSWKTFERKMQSRNTRSSARKVLFRFWK